MFAGIDVGTTNAKMTVYSERGDEIAQSSHNYQCRQLHVISAESLWSAVRNCITDISRRLDGYGRIDALAVSSFGESIVAVDKEGNALSEIMLRTCESGEKELSEIINNMSEKEIHKITGLFPDKRF